VQNDELGVVKHRHADDGAAGEGHVVEVRVEGEVIAQRMYAARQPELRPWKRFTARGHRVHLLGGSGLVGPWTACLQKDGGLWSAGGMRTIENLKSEIISRRWT